MRKLLIVLFIVALFLPFNIALGGGNKSDISIGDTRVLKGGYEAIYKGKTLEGDSIWQANLAAPKYLDDLTTPIECKWNYDDKNDERFSGANLFNATVKDRKVTVEYQGKKMYWQPKLEVNGKQQVESHANLLYFDPINENYFRNTLQWSYESNITRNLRLIEGMLIEYYIVSELPVGDITIKTNTNKDAGFIWTRPVSVWDANGEPVDVIIDGHDVTLTLEAMQNATFPITIDPDTPFTTSASDGYFYSGGEVGATTTSSWNNMHDSSTPYALWKTQNIMHVYINTFQQGGGNYVTWIDRAAVFFSTDSLSDSCSITAAILRLYGTSNPETDDGAWTMVIQEGMPDYPHDPFVTSDYLYSRYAGNGGTLASSAMGIGYKNITLSSDGRDWINKEGDTKLLLKNKNFDADDVKPTYLAYPGGSLHTSWEFYTYEQGEGYRPQLIVTYTVSPPSITTDAASNIANTAARLNSEVIGDGGEVCDVRFQYGNGTSNDTPIDIGSGASDRDEGFGNGWTRIDTSNPANDNGTITDVQIWAVANMAGTKVGIFNETSSGIFKCRSVENLGNVTSGSVQNFSGLNLTVETGDVIGLYWLTGTLDGNLTEGTQEWHVFGDTCIVDNETTYSDGATAVLSLYGNGSTAVGGGNYTVNTTWVNDTYSTGDHPYADITGLTKNTTYYFRAQISNSNSTVNGSQLNFTTTSIIGNITNLRAYPDATFVSLAWTRGDGASQTLIRYAFDTYPANVTSGTQLYSGTDVTTNHTGLSIGTTTYYTAWGESGGNYSAGNATVATTTSAATAGSGDDLEVPPAITGWMQTPDPTGLSNFEPVYSIANDMADSLSIPQSSFWMGLMLLIAVAMGVLILATTHSMLGGVGVMLLVMVAGLSLGLLPSWMIFVVIIAGVGMGVMATRTA